MLADPLHSIPHSLLQPAMIVAQHSPFTPVEWLVIALVLLGPFILGVVLALAALILWSRTRWGARLCLGLSLLSFAVGWCVWHYA